MAEEQEDQLVFAVVPISIVTKNYAHSAGSFVHETYSNARKLTHDRTATGAWSDTRTMKVVSRRIYGSDMLKAHGSVQIVRNINGWEDVSSDDHHVYNAEDALGGRKGLS